MKEIILAFFLAFGGYTQPGQYKHRFDKDTYQRIRELFPYVKQAGWNTDTPPRYVLGVIHNESQGLPNAIGDGGLSLGLGQIRCPWLSTIDKVGLDVITSCKNHLHDAEWSVYAIAEILSYIKDRYDLSWKETLKVYHLGPPGLTDVDDSAYVNRTLFFVEYWNGYYENWRVLSNTAVYSL